MGDELPAPESLPGDLYNSVLPSLPDAEQALIQVGQTVDDCAQAVAEAQDIIERDLNDCLNSCHGDMGLCHACILGDIDQHINKAGLATTACGQRIIDAVNTAVSEAYNAAYGVGVRPPTEAQIAAAVAGMPIPDDTIPVVTVGADGGATTGLGTGTVTVDRNGPGGTVQIGGSILPVLIGGQADPTSMIPVLVPGITAPAPTQVMECVPTDWGATQILQWLLSVYGGAVQIITLPDAENHGSAVVNGTLTPIPAVCVVGPPPVGTGGTGTGTGTGRTTGGTGTGGATGGQGDNISQGCQLINTADSSVIQYANQQAQALGYLFADAAGNCPPGYEHKKATFIRPSDGAAVECDYCIPKSTGTGTGTDGGGTGGGTDGGGTDGGGDNGTICPPCPPVTPTEPATPQAIPPGLKACDPDNLDEAIRTITVTIPNTGQTFGRLVADFLGQSPADCPTGVIDAITSPLKTISCFVSGVLDGLLKQMPWVANFTQVGGVEGACNAENFTSAVVVNGILGFFSRWANLLPEFANYEVAGGLNYCYQYRIPSTGEAAAAYSRGYLDQKQAEFAWKYNGDCVPWQRKLLESRRTRIGIQDAYRLWRLGKLTDVEMTEAWKRQGIDVDKEFTRWEDAVQQYPGMADLIRMMVRDVGDPEVVQLLGLDDQFAQKWQDSPDAPLQTWGKAQGVSDDVAKLFWRAHWTAPSPQQVFQWLYRLRPDDRDPDDPNKDVVVTEDQAAKLLKIADYVPGLVRNYIAAAYRPITRRDISRLYRIGVLKDEDAVRRAYRDLGNSAAAAAAIAKGVIATERPATAKWMGELSANDVLTQYRGNLLTHEEAEPLLKKAGLTDEQIAVTLDAADVKRRAASRAVVIKSLRLRYFRGEFSDAQAAQQLSDAFMALGQASDTVRLWKAERQAKEKSPTIALLCKWFGQGQITLDEYQRRVENLNYSVADALRIVESCNFDVQQRRQKEIERALAAQQKAQQQANRLQAAAIREAKQAARALKMMDVSKHKTSTRVNAKGDTTTITDTRTLHPDVNISTETEHVSITTTPPK